LIIQARLTPRNIGGEFTVKYSQKNIYSIIMRAQNILKSTEIFLYNTLKK